MPAVNGDVIRRGRLAKGLTQLEVVAECAARGEQIDNSNLSKMERDHLGCPPRLLPVLAQVLGLRVDDLLAEPTANDDEQCVS